MVNICKTSFFGLFGKRHDWHRNVGKTRLRVCSKCGLLQELNYGLDGDGYWVNDGIVDNSEKLIKIWDRQVEQKTLDDAKETEAKKLFKHRSRSWEDLQ